MEQGARSREQNVRIVKSVYDAEFVQVVQTVKILKAAKIVERFGRVFLNIRAGL